MFNWILSETHAHCLCEKSVLKEKKNLHLEVKVLKITATETGLVVEGGGGGNIYFRRMRNLLSKILIFSSETHGFTRHYCFYFPIDILSNIYILNFQTDFCTLKSDSARAKYIL